LLCTNYKSKKIMLLSENELIICFHGHVPASHSCLPFLGSFWVATRPTTASAASSVSPFIALSLSLSLFFFYQTEFW
jgi:hypothetical protein